jgi:hypothetical protein
VAHIPDRSSKTLRGLTGKAVTPGARVITDGWLGSKNPLANPHEVRIALRIAEPHIPPKRDI